LEGAWVVTPPKFFPPALRGFLLPFTFPWGAHFGFCPVFGAGGGRKLIPAPRLHTCRSQWHRTETRCRTRPSPAAASGFGKLSGRPSPAAGTAFTTKNAKTFYGFSELVERTNEWVVPILCAAAGPSKTRFFLPRPSGFARGMHLSLSPLFLFSLSSFPLFSFPLSPFFLSSFPLPFFSPSSSPHFFSLPAPARTASNIPPSRRALVNCGLRFG